jgi:hypothetical protein
MARLPGRLDLTPVDPRGWLRQIAAVAVRIHEVQAVAPPFRSQLDAPAPAINPRLGDPPGALAGRLRRHVRGALG